MSKKTVNVSQQLLTSILIGFFLAVIIVIVAHVSPKKWTFMPAGSGEYFRGDSKVLWCSYECMLGERHAADCSGVKAAWVGDKKLTVGEIVSASFKHMSTILLIGLIASAVIYIIKRVSFKVVKE